MTTTKPPSSLESLRLAAMRSRAKQRTPSQTVTQSVAAAFSRDEKDSSEDEVVKRGQEDRTPSPNGLEQRQAISLAISKTLDPTLQTAVTSALADLSSAGLSYHDIISFGNIHPLFLSTLVSSVSIPSSPSPAEASTKPAETTTISSSAPHSETLTDQKDTASKVQETLAELVVAGLSYNDIVSLGGVHPVYLAQLVLQAPDELPHKVDLLAQAGATIEQVSASLAASAASTSTAAAAAGKPVPSKEQTESHPTPASSEPAATEPKTTPAVKSDSAQTVKQDKQDKQDAKDQNGNGANGKSPAKGKRGRPAKRRGKAEPQPPPPPPAAVPPPPPPPPAAPTTATDPAGAAPTPERQTRSKIITNGKNSVTITGNSVNVSRTLRRRPTAMDFDDRRASATNTKFGSDRMRGKIVIEMSDSESEG
ncbi:hypothetical protein BZA70DRAFT_162140 [Myxozyma melibiosi]|uniref:Uncharacterized protein n=1 Tax=Myxozyma melibiosi TaxID=54550 RepID=A0ABR1F6T3_9ASCO